MYFSNKGGLKIIDYVIKSIIENRDYLSKIDIAF